MVLGSQSNQSSMNIIVAGALKFFFTSAVLIRDLTYCTDITHGVWVLRSMDNFGNERLGQE